MGDDVEEAPLKNRYGMRNDVTVNAICQTSLCAALGHHVKSYGAVEKCIPKFHPARRHLSMGNFATC
jgi:hypothetical protein